MENLSNSFEGLVVGKVVCDSAILNTWCLNLELKLLLGIVLDASVKVLQQWMQRSWGSRQFNIPDVQDLPTNYLHFLIKECDQEGIIF